MINIKELERRWLKYKAKSALLFGSIISTFGALIYGGYYILFELDFESKDNKSKIVVESNSSNVAKKDIKLVEKNSTTQDKKQDLQPEDNQLLLTPIIPIIEESDDKSPKKETAIRVKRGHKRDIKRVYRASKPRPKPKVVESPKVDRGYIKRAELHKEDSEPPKIELKMTSNNYMAIMKEKFLKNKNPRDAILIARAYFRAGNYDKAKEWSLKANSLNNSLEESWILFAKSKQMLGESREALKILLTYYKKSKSKRVRELIEKMKTESM